MRRSVTNSSTPSSSQATIAADGALARPPLELSFWRTLYRYLLTIVASLASGAAWFLLGVNNGGLLHLRLGFLATILTGILALAVGVFIAGYLWLAIDLRSTPEGVDPADRQFQLFVLWLGIPLGVLLVCGVVALVSILVANTVLSGGVAR